MNDNPTVLKRGNITYMLFSDKVLVGVGSHQWVSYNQYDNYNRQGITMFRNKILKSQENEYASASEQMSLAFQCGIKGSSTRKPQL